MNHSLKILLAASTISILAACGNNSSSTSADAATGKSTELSAAAAGSNAAATPTLAVDAYRPAAATVSAQDSPMKPRDLSAAPIPTNVNLGAPLASQTTAARQSNEAVAADHMGKPLQIGFGRAVTQTSTAAATQQVLKWKTTSSGAQVAAINFNSAGAKGMRVGVLVTQLPETATLRFYAKGATTAFEVKGKTVLDVLAKNLAAGDKTDEGRTYWGPLNVGVDASVEIELPAGTSTSSINISIPSISHMFMSMKEATTFSRQDTYASIPDDSRYVTKSCQIDVNCTTPLPAASDSVAWLVYVKNGVASSCSGTLLNDNINSSTPYILTANHCFSTQTVASTLYSEFKFKSASCNAVNGSYFPTATTGSTLLYTAYSTDTTLVRLAGTPAAANVLFSGWDATATPASTAILNLHHPRGDAQRLSRGIIDGFLTRAPINSEPNYAESFYGSNSTNGTIFDATLTVGLTEQGSSGSGLFKGSDSNPQLIGQLFGGNTPSCSATSINNVYGRFDVAFNAGMKDWLVRGRKPIYRFYNTGNGSHFYSVSETEKNYVRASIASYFYEGPAFNADNVSSTTTSPVYRFYNSTTQSHFYTISEIEKADVIARLPQFAYEGISWYAKTVAQHVNNDGTIPLYRFYNLSNGTHFYTNSESEKANVIATLSKTYLYEGPAYYVWP